jgi:uncharacterized protein YjiS (DUF1127 family)
MLTASFGRWRERRERKAAIRDLRALSDRTLKDMGLTRGEIVAAAHGRVYRGEPVRRHEPEPPSLRTAARVDPIEPAALRAHIERARQLRAETIADLSRRSVDGLFRFARRPFRRPARPQRPCRGLLPLDSLAGHREPGR